MAKEIDINNEDFGLFLEWYKDVYGNSHIEDHDTARDIINIVMLPHRFQREYTEYQLVKYQESEGK